MNEKIDEKLNITRGATTMKYNFDQVIDRNGNRAAKYDERVKKFGTGVDIKSF